jgi:hypothetical protein
MVLPLVPASSTTTPGPSAGTHLLIAHMRYMGKREDFDQDMSKVGEDPETQRWWKVSYLIYYVWSLSSELMDRGCTLPC